jgi:hypothetical protein
VLTAASEVLRRAEPTDPTEPADARPVRAARGVAHRQTIRAAVSELTFRDWWIAW